MSATKLVVSKRIDIDLSFIANFCVWTLLYHYAILSARWTPLHPSPCLTIHPQTISVTLQIQYFFDFGRLGELYNNPIIRGYKVVHVNIWPRLARSLICLHLSESLGKWVRLILSHNPHRSLNPWVAVGHTYLVYQSVAPEATCILMSWAAIVPRKVYKK